MSIGSVGGIAKIDSVFKDMSEEDLVKWLQNPDQNVPAGPILALQNLKQKQEMRTRMDAEQSRGQGAQPTTAQEILMASEQPQQPQMMNAGGIVQGYADGGAAMNWVERLLRQPRQDTKKTTFADEFRKMGTGRTPSDAERQARMRADMEKNPIADIMRNYGAGLQTRAQAEPRPAIPPNFQNPTQLPAGAFLRQNADPTSVAGAVPSIRYPGDPPVPPANRPTGVMPNVGTGNVQVRSPMPSAAQQPSTMDIPGNQNAPAGQTPRDTANMLMAKAQELENAVARGVMNTPAKMQQAGMQIAQLRQQAEAIMSQVQGTAQGLKERQLETLQERGTGLRYYAQRNAPPTATPTAPASPQMGPPQPYSPRLPPSTGARGEAPGYRSGIPLEVQDVPRQGTPSEFDRQLRTDMDMMNPLVPWAPHRTPSEAERKARTAKDMKNMGWPSPTTGGRMDAYHGMTDDSIGELPPEVVVPPTATASQEERMGPPWDMVGRDTDVYDMSGQIDPSPPRAKQKPITTSPAAVGGATPPALSRPKILSETGLGGIASKDNLLEMYKKNREELGGGQQKKILEAQRKAMEAGKPLKFGGLNIDNDAMGLAAFKILERASAPGATLGQALGAGGTEFFQRSSMNKKEQAKLEADFRKMELSYQADIDANASKVATGQMTANQAARSNALKKAQLNLDYQYKTQVLGASSNTIKTVKELMGLKVTEAIPSDRRAEAVGVASQISGAGRTTQTGIEGVRRGVFAHVRKMAENQDIQLLPVPGAPPGSKVSMGEALTGRAGPELQKQAVEELYRRAHAEPGIQSSVYFDEYMKTFEKRPDASAAPAKKRFDPVSGVTK